MFVVFLWPVCHGVVGCGLLDFVRVSFDLTDSDFALMTTCFKMISKSTTMKQQIGLGVRTATYQLHA